MSPSDLKPKIGEQKVMRYSVSPSDGKIEDIRW
jgi:hypothetical protein